MHADSDTIIEWDEDGYPTPESLERLRQALKDNSIKKAKKAFYAALRENWYHLCGPEQVEVRGEVIDVWGYHTGGWSGNEEIIAVLQEQGFLWWWLLQRYDRGGHYYFQMPPHSWLEEEEVEEGNS